MFATWWIICFGAFKSYQWKQYVIRCTRVARPLWLFDVGDWFRFIFCTFIRFVIVNEYRIPIKQKAFIRISLGDSSSQRFTKFYSFFVEDTGCRSRDLRCLLKSVSPIQSRNLLKTDFIGQFFEERQSLLANCLTLVRIESLLTTWESFFQTSMLQPCLKLLLFLQVFLSSWLINMDKLLYSVHPSKGITI